MAGVLSSIRVIDFGRWIAGPLSSLLLADQGAEVIHRDPPSGPRWQTAANATLQRGKKSLILDLKNKTDLALARALISSADVLIENFRPGVMNRLGLGSEAVRHSHDRLIYCSLPGFAADDPRAARSAWLVNGAAAGGRPADPWSGVYECRDGVMALLNLATPRFVRRFLEATGTLEEWTTKGYLEPDRLVPDSELWTQQRDDLSALLRTRTAEEWDRLATQVLFPLTRIRTSAAHRDRAAQGKGEACCRLPLIVEDTSQEDKAYEMVSLSGRANH